MVKSFDMENSKIISFTFNSSFALWKKPDINEGIYLTYNSIPKPALLGILGAIIGLGGHTQAFYSKAKLPEFYTCLNDIKCGIVPVAPNGIFPKTVITYSNTVGYANKDGNLIVSEQTLLKPQYKIYLLINDVNAHHKELYDNIRSGRSIFIPYMGKNDFNAWWLKESFAEHPFTVDKKSKGRKSISTLFIKPASRTVRDDKIDPFATIIDFSSPLAEESYMSFEQLPVGYDDVTYNYAYEDFVFTNHLLSEDFIAATPDLYYLPEEDFYIQLN